MDAYFSRRSAEVLNNICYATIATADSQGHPWNTPVYSSRDGELNIYWISDKQNQHSRNVRQNPHVFIVFYDSTVPPGSGEGVYIRALATELSDPEEISMAWLIIGEDGAIGPEQFTGDDIQRIYRATPLDAWMNTAEFRGEVFIRDYRVQIPLAELKSSANVEARSDKPVALDPLQLARAQGR